jgi:hypothetical protein
MKAEILTLVAATMIGASPMSAQSKLQVMEVNQILADPDQYRGLTIAVHGVVDKVTPEHQTFTIVDSRRWYDFHSKRERTARRSKRDRDCPFLAERCLHWQ